MMHPEKQQWPVTMQVSKNGTAPLMSSYSQPPQTSTVKADGGKMLAWVMDSLIGLATLEESGCN